MSDSKTPINLKDGSKFKSFVIAFNEDERRRQKLFDDVEKSMAQLQAMRQRKTADDFHGNIDMDLIQQGVSDEAPAAPPTTEETRARENYDFGERVLHRLGATGISRTESDGGNEKKSDLVPAPTEKAFSPTALTMNSSASSQGWQMPRAFTPHFSSAAYSQVFGQLDEGENAEKRGKLKNTGSAVGMYAETARSRGENACDGEDAFKSIDSPARSASLSRSTVAEPNFYQSCQIIGYTVEPKPTDDLVPGEQVCERRYEDGLEEAQNAPVKTRPLFELGGLWTISEHSTGSESSDVPLKQSESAKMATFSDYSTGSSQNEPAIEPKISLSAIESQDTSSSLDDFDLSPLKIGYGKEYPKDHLSAIWPIGDQDSVELRFARDEWKEPLGLPWLYPKKSTWDEIFVGMSYLLERGRDECQGNERYYRFVVAQERFLTEYLERSVEIYKTDLMLLNPIHAPMLWVSNPLRIGEHMSRLSQFKYYYTFGLRELFRELRDVRLDFDTDNLEKTTAMFKGFITRKLEEDKEKLEYSETRMDLSFVAERCGLPEEIRTAQALKGLPDDFETFFKNEKSHEKLAKILDINDIDINLVYNELDRIRSKRFALPSGRLLRRFLLNLCKRVVRVDGVWTLKSISSEDLFEYIPFTPRGKPIRNKIPVPCVAYPISL